MSAGPFGRWWLAVWMVMSGAAAGTEPAGTPVELGRRLFTHNFGRPHAWTEPQPLGAGGDGLGPQFNDFSCAACHRQAGVGGAGPNEKNALVLSVLPGAGLKRTELEAVVDRAHRMHPELSATQASAPLHRFGLPQESDSRPYEQHLAELFDEVGFDPQQTAPARGERPHANFEICQRNTTALWGVGQIEELRQREGNGIRRRVMDENNRRYAWLSGRIPRDVRQNEAWFGWRGQAVSLHEFNLGACATELGLTVPGNPQHPSPVAPGATMPAGLDLTELQCFALTSFVASLPAPRQVLPTDVSALARVQMGEEVFNRCHCQACHCRDLGWVTGIYSDLLLHDLGPGLCDAMEAMFEVIPGETIPGVLTGGGPYGGPPVDLFMPPRKKPTNCDCEWRTPPLWGCADSAPYLHDGRAATLDAAIRLHGGESETSMLAYRALPPDEAALLLSFLESLRAPQPAAVDRVPPRLASATPAAAEPSAGLENAPLASPNAGPAAAAAELPPAEAVSLERPLYEALDRLLTQLKPGDGDRAEAQALAQRLQADATQPGLGDFALALFEKQALRHEAFLGHLNDAARKTGVYAAEARQGLIREELRRREYGAAAAALESHLTLCRADATLSPRAAAEQAEWAGVVAAWLAGPADLNAPTLELATLPQQIRIHVPDELTPWFDRGVNRVAALQSQLEAERAALVDLAAASQQSRQAELAAERQQLEAQSGTLQQSREQTQTAFEQELKKLDEQLAELEKQYAESDARTRQLAEQCAVLMGQIGTLQTIVAVQAKSSTGRSWGGGARTTFASELVALNDKLAFFGRQREESAGQARVIALQAQSLVQRRQALLARYQQAAGQAAQQQAALGKWQTRLTKQSAAADAPVDRSKAVQQLDRKLRDLATYDRFDSREAARLMLARYRPAE